MTNVRATTPSPPTPPYGVAEDELDHVCDAPLSVEAAEVPDDRNLEHLAAVPEVAELAPQWRGGRGGERVGSETHGSWSTEPFIGHGW
jgi:hypothetical protein